MYISLMDVVSCQALFTAESLTRQHNSVPSRIHCQRGQLKPLASSAAKRFVHTMKSENCSIITETEIMNEPGPVASFL